MEGMSIVFGRDKRSFSNFIQLQVIVMDASRRNRFLKEYFRVILFLGEKL